MTPSSKACACRMKNNRTKQGGMNPSKKFFWGVVFKKDGQNHEVTFDFQQKLIHVAITHV